MEFSDARNKGSCVHCGGPYETDDHIPSKVFLDEEFPDNLGTSPSCEKCNNGFSKDEEYLACLLECIVCGSVEASLLQRTKIAHRLQRSPGLAALINYDLELVDGQKIWHVDIDRVKNVLLKLARCHTSYELAEPRTDSPTRFFFKPLPTMSHEERQAFQGQGKLGFTAWPEVGSRAMSRLLIVDNDVHEEGWLIVQPDRYRFRALLNEGLTIRIVIREYLACEVSWE